MRGAEGRLTSVWWWRLLILLSLIALLYADTLTHLAAQWHDNPDFSHGFLVPLFSAGVVWHKRKETGALSPAPSWLGLGVIAG
ncbi:MAG: archaeosortase/exosortase family protein, partial [Candidatus Acidiferrales bacterium]